MAEPTKAPAAAFVVSFVRPEQMATLVAVAADSPEDAVVEAKHRLTLGEWFQVAGGQVEIRVAALNDHTKELIA